MVSLSQTLAPAATYEPVTESELVRTSEAVFTGKILSGRVVKRPDETLETRIVVRTETVWKGRLPRRIVVVQPGGCLGDTADCASLAVPLRRGETRLFCAARRRDGEVVIVGGPEGAALARGFEPGSSWTRRTARIAEHCRIQRDPGPDWSGLAPRGDDSVAFDQHPEIPQELSFRSVTESGLSEYRVPAGSDPSPTRFLAPDRGAPIPYLVDMDALPPGMTSEDALDHVDEAFAAWTAATGIEFEPEGVVSFGQAASSVTTQDGRIRVQLHDLYDAVPQDTTLGFGGLRLVNGGLPEGGSGGRVYGREFHRTTLGYVIINHNHAQVANPANFTEVLCHEIGHALGLAHSSETTGEVDAARKDALMYYLAHLDGRGADLRAYDLATIAQSYPFEDKPPFVSNRVLDITTHPQLATLGNPQVNRIDLLGSDQESLGTSLTLELHATRTTSNSGSFTLVGRDLTYLATGYYDSPRVDLAGTSYYDRALYRAGDGVHASPWAVVRVISYRPDSQPNPVVDGLPDAWVSGHFPDDSFTGALMDPDSDGSTTFEEYLTETDPQDAESVLRASFSDAQIAVSAEGGVVLATVELDRAVLKNVAVPWSVSPDSTASNDDYELHFQSTSPLVIPAGETSAALRIDLTSDELPENAETIVLDLGDPDPGVLGVSSRVTITIPSEDIVPEYDFAVANYSVAEGDAPSVFGAVTLQRSAVTDVESSVNVLLTGSSGAPAAPGSDLQAGPVLVAFAAGETQRNVPLSLFGDLTFESDEEVTLTLAEFEPAGKPGAMWPSAVLTLLNDDPPPALGFNALGFVESESAVLSGSLSTASGLPVYFQYSLLGDSAEAGVDFAAASGEMVIPAGETAFSIPVELVDDALNEGLERFAIQLDGLEGVTAVDGLVYASIIDDDPAPTVSASEFAGFEDEGQMQFSIVLSAPSGHAVSVEYRLDDGTAIAGQDYVATPGVVQFSPGQTEWTGFVDLLNDPVFEGVETFTLRLSTPLNALIAAGSAEGRIQDDDTAPRLSVGEVSAAENEGVLRFDLTLSNPSANEVQIGYGIEAGSAEPGDFVAGAGSVIFEPGVVESSLSVMLVDDAIDESDETVLLVLASESDVLIPPALVSGLIIDDDAPPEMSASGLSVVEFDGAARFAVMLSGPSELPVIFSYSTEQGTATAGADFEERSGEVEIAAGATSVEIEVPLVDDEVWEEAESFFLAIVRADGGQPEMLRVEAWITDDELRVGLPTLAIAFDRVSGKLTLSSWTGSAAYEIEWSLDARMWRPLESADVVVEGEMTIWIFDVPDEDAALFRLRAD